ncbi:uncharacterized protein LOC141906520 [Tubulanus polymorphus]|uniref:uncharacterized protein LOC141906520 n=1 Tax=Tubulanus polymorphus TaxID=672921 RepID=UPI003DA5A51D
MFVPKFRMIRRQSLVILVVLLLTAIVTVIYVGNKSNPRKRNERGSSMIEEFRVDKREFIYTQKPVREDTRVTTRKIQKRKLTNYSMKQIQPNESDNITIVTAFFDIGVISKWGGIWRSPETYRNWMWSFRRIDNPVIAYFDSPYHAFHFKKVRSYLPSNLTKIVIMKRRFLKSFSFENQIRNIIHRADYSTAIRQTLKSQYPCVMHSKYELMERAVINNVFKTEYFAWIDIGLFRDLTGQDQFKLALPPNFDETRISYDQVSNVTMDATLSDIFHNASTWVCGCIFIGKQDLMLRWTRLYMKYVQMFLDMGYAGTDEQVLFAMYSNSMKVKPAIRVQAHLPIPKYGAWFSLGYLCKDQWIKTHKKTKHLNV